MFSQQHRSVHRLTASNDNGPPFARATGQVTRSGGEEGVAKVAGAMVVSYVADRTFILSGSRAA